MNDKEFDKEEFITRLEDKNVINFFEKAFVQAKFFNGKSNFEMSGK